MSHGGIIYSSLDHEKEGSGKVIGRFQGERFRFLFPTCQVRVSRFYQSWPAHLRQISVGTAGPQPRAPASARRQGHCRTSTARARSQWARRGLNCECKMSHRMPDRLSEEMSHRMPARMSERTPDRMPAWMLENMPDRKPDRNPDRTQSKCQIEYQNECLKRCQIECQNRC